MTALVEWLSIGDVAERTGVAASALRYYESLGLIASERAPNNQRRFPRAVLRRVSIIRAAQAVGLSLESIREALAALPDGRTPTPNDWERMSTRWRTELNQRIAAMERLRDDLSSCIGCGCLSLERCRLFNQGDIAATAGPGARYLMGDLPPNGTEA